MLDDDRLSIFHLGFELVGHFDIYFIILHFQCRQLEHPPFTYQVVKAFFVEIMTDEAPYQCTWNISIVVNEVPQ